MSYLKGPAIKNENRLTDIEWGTLWMAIRYAMNRQTIASATLPEEIVRHYYKRLSNGQKLSILKDLEENEEDYKRMTDGKQLAFGHPDIDRPRWLKFMASLDVESHKNYVLIDNTQCVCFEANGKIYPLDKYLEFPGREVFLPKENIKIKL